MKRRDFLWVGALLLAGCAAQPKPQGAAAGVSFSPAEREMITAYFTQLRGRGPATQAPAAAVQPGSLLQSGSRPNKLPVELASKLAHLPEPYTRLTLGADVILLNRATQRIEDVIPAVAY